MQATLPLLPSPTPTACEVWQWLRKQKPVISFDQFIRFADGKYLLPLFGTVHGGRLYELLTGEAKKSLGQKMQYQLTCIQEITKYHVVNLIANQPLELPTPSMYQSRTIYDDPPLERYILGQIRQMLAYSSCPLLEAKLYKFHRIPQYHLEESSMGTYVERLDEKNWKIIQLILSWFDEKTPTPTALTLTAESWIECQIALLHLEALPGISFAEAISQWMKEIPSQSPASALLPLWQALSTFFPLFSEKQVKKFSCTASGQVTFGRPPGLVLRKEETFQAYLIRNSQHSIIALILKAIGPKIYQFNVDTFTTSFIAYCAPVLKNERIRMHLLYFIDVISEGYKKVPLKDNAPNASVANKLFRHYSKFLKRLFSNETGENDRFIKSFPLDRKEAYAFLYRLLLCYHTVALLPAKVNFELSLFINFLQLPLDALDRLTSYWKFVKAQTNVPIVNVLDVNVLLANSTKTAIERIELLTSVVVDSNHLRPKDATLSLRDHFHFIQQLESNTKLCLDPVTRHFLLTTLPLKPKVLPFLTEFDELRTSLSMSAKKMPLYYEEELISRLESWNINALPDALIPPGDLVEHPASPKMMGEVTTFFNYCLLPSGLSWLYCRFLSLAKIMAQKEEPDYKIWQWAQLHNAALIELSPTLRAMRVECKWAEQTGPQDVPALELSLLWVDSLQSLVTRQVKKTLQLANLPVQKQNVLFLPTLATKLCSNRPYEDLDLSTLPKELIQFCTQLKNELTLAITSESDPVVQFNIHEQSFYITSIKRPLALQALQVNLTECREIFAKILAVIHAKKSGQEAQLFCTMIWKEKKLFQQPIDILFAYQRCGCMGDGEEEGKILDKSFYRIILRFSDQPDVAFSVTYLEPPTVELLGWQLALLKERYAQLTLGLC